MTNTELHIVYGGIILVLLFIVYKATSTVASGASNLLNSGSNLLNQGAQAASNMSAAFGQEYIDAAQQGDSSLL